MSELYESDEIYYEVYAGADIVNTAKSMIEKKKEIGKDIVCSFNGVVLRTSRDKTPEQIIRHYNETI